MNIQAKVFRLIVVLMAAFVGINAAIRYVGPILIVSQATDTNAEDAPYPEPQSINLQTEETQSETEGWPQLFGPRQNSISDESNIVTKWDAKGPKEAWRVPIGTGYSSPVVHRGQVIVLYRVEDEEIVSSFDLESGKSNWDFKYPTKYECQWPPHSSGPYSTPICSGNHVFVQGAEGTLRCLNFDDGTEVWGRNLSQEFDVPEQVFAVGHTPVLDGDLLIVNVGGKKAETGIMALTKSDGKTFWSSTNHKASYSTPSVSTIHKKRFVFVLTGNGLVSLDRDTGNVYWEIEFHSKSDDAPAAVTPLVYGDIVLATVYQAGTICLRILPDGQYDELWRSRRSFESQFNPVVCIDGYVYGWHFFDQSLRCVELTSGKPQWKHKSILGRGTQIAVDGRLILFGEDGHLGSVDINPQELVEVCLTGEAVLKRPCYSAPALSDGRLIVRNEIELLCLDLRKATSSETTK